MSFRYVAMYEEGETSNLYLDIFVPPFHEILLNVYIYKGQKHLLFSKKIKKRNIFEISEITKICDPEEECLIFSEISNYFYTIENNNYYGTKENNSNFIYIQYLNSYSRDNYMIINKLSKEFSNQNNDNNGKTIYKYEIKEDFIYEFYINFDKRPKSFEVFVGNSTDLKKIKKIKMDKSGRYMINFIPNISSKIQYLVAEITDNSYSSSFTYYLRELNKPLKIISNENVHGYFSEMENNILQYNYTFEEEISSFYLEIFSKNTQIKIEDISDGQSVCSNFINDFTKLNSSELIKFNCPTKLSNNSTILISFRYSGKIESERHLRFRLLPNNIGDNIVYLKESEESICDPNYGEKYCFFYFNLPKNILKGDIVSIYGYYEDIPKNLNLYSKQISIKDELTIKNFEQLKEEYNNLKEKNLDYLELEIISKYFKLSYNNYIIGLFETDGKSKIRMVYTIFQPNNNLDERKFIISPGEKKYYSFLGKKGEEILEFKYGDFDDSEFQGFLYLSKINQKFSLSTSTLYQSKINIEEITIIELGDLNEGNEDDIFISSIFKPLCNFYIQYDIFKKNDIFLFDLKKDKPYIIYFMQVRTPIHFYLPIMENNYDLKINFKFEEEYYLEYDNDYYLKNFTLYALLVDDYFISEELYLNYEELNLSDYNKEHYLNNLYHIEVLNAEKIFLISFNNSKNIDEKELTKYKYLFLSFFYKEKKYKDDKDVKLEYIKFQIITFQNNNDNLILPQYKYFYSYLSFQEINSNIFYLKSDLNDNCYLISIASEEFDYLNIKFDFNTTNNLSEPYCQDIIPGQWTYYLPFPKKKIVDFVNISISINNNIISQAENKKIYYSIKYLTAKINKIKDKNLDNIIPRYIFNAKNPNEPRFYFNYENIDNLIKLRWSPLLNETGKNSYVQSKYILRFFYCDKYQNICEKKENYKITIFPNKYKENEELLHFINGDEIEIECDDEFKYKVALFAYFEDPMGEEFVFAYDNVIVSHKTKNYYFWIIIIVFVFIFFIITGFLILYIKIKEERDYFQREKERISLSSFSTDNSREEEGEEHKIFKAE